MALLFIIVCLQVLPYLEAQHGDSEGNSDSECKPLELGIVLDSSSSISRKDYKKMIAFLGDFLKNFDIGSSSQSVRVSVIPFSTVIHTDNSFNLNTYDTKEEVLAAVAALPHRLGQYTWTGKAIKYMNEEQLSAAVVRPNATKIGIVITDGDSQNVKVTKQEAQKAKEAGITMFAVGLGKVKQSELINIAGTSSRVFHVDNYDKLVSIIEKLVKDTCEIHFSYIPA